MVVVVIGGVARRRSRHAMHQRNVPNVGKRRRQTPEPGFAARTDVAGIHGALDTVDMRRFRSDLEPIIGSKNDGPPALLDVRFVNRHIRIARRRHHATRCGARGAGPIDAARGRMPQRKEALNEIHGS